MAISVPIEHRLIGFAPDARPVALSLNAIAMYGGIALGGVIGGLAISQLDTAAPRLGRRRRLPTRCRDAPRYLEASGRRHATAARRWRRRLRRESAGRRRGPCALSLRAGFAPVTGDCSRPQSRNARRANGEPQVSDHQRVLGNADT
jgi:hypothetical protein